MNIKYMKYLTSSHLVKVALPVVLIAVLFFLKGTIADQTKSFMSGTINRNKDIFKVKLKGDDDKFAMALVREKSIDQQPKADFSPYLNREFIKRQKNDITIVMQTEQRQKESKAAKPKLAPPPMFKVSSIFIGKSRRFAVINDKIVVSGDILRSGEEVIDIKDGKVLVRGQWGERWLFVTY